MSNEDIMNRLEQKLEQLSQSQVDAREVAQQILSFLGNELGYDNETQGNVNRRLTETRAIVDSHEIILRGEADRLGLVGWMHVLRRSWWAILVAAASVTSYILGAVFQLPN